MENKYTAVRTAVILAAAVALWAVKKQGGSR
jgi:hypothetical protein